MKHFFLHDVVKFNMHDAYFIQKQDPCGAMGLFMIQKCLAIIRMLSYDMAIGVRDKYVWIIKNTTMESLRCFC
jgi:hypothetical protein